MNTYVIITNGIVDIGGGQLYVNSKVEFLEKEGWRVIVYSAVEGRVLITNLQRFSNNIITSLKIYPMHLSSKKRNGILQGMSDDIGESGQVLIESHSTTYAVWGEMLACLCNGKHLVYNINECPKCPPQLYPFFRFKYDRKELAVIKENVIVNFFKPYFEVKDAETRVLSAVYSVSQVDDICFEGLNDFDETRKTIGIVGRLEKPFVLESIRNLAGYCKRNSSSKFNIIIIGGEQGVKIIEKEIHSQFSNVKNVRLYMMGYLFPMPRKLIKLMDVCISSSGAVGSVAREGILTIAIDANDLKPIGIWGVTTNNRLFRKDEPIQNLGDILDSVFDEKYDIGLLDAIKKESPRKIDSLKEHLDFVNQSKTDKAYYKDFKCLSIMKKSLILILGVNGYAYLWKKFHK